MATSEHPTAGLMPATNDLLAFVAVVGAYITRFGVLAEGAMAWWYLPLVLTTDMLLPLLGGLWLVGVPLWQVWQRYRN
jgi:hypothetical protein